MGWFDNELLILENIYVNLKNVSCDFKIVINSSKIFYKKIDGIVVTQDGNNQYYGEDFSGFYYSWKLGKIGLVALDGRGQFQGAIDEEWLLNKGYEKKTI